LIQVKEDSLLDSETGHALKEKQDTNRLFPVFLKLENLSVLLIGGGNVALEKLHAIINNAPNTVIHIVTETLDERIEKLLDKHQQIQVSLKSYESSDLKGADIAIVAVNDLLLSDQIYKDAKRAGVLINVADKPELCDFYLSSIVQKGNLKIAISTNGKSPTIAKRLKEVLNDALPIELHDLLDNMEQVRGKLKGNFASKVNKLNKITKVLIDDERRDYHTAEKNGGVLLQNLFLLSSLCSLDISF